MGNGYAIGPRKVGGRYFSGGWRQEYDVLALSDTGRAGWRITVRWADGRETSHCTAWDPRRDRVVSQPV
jgi:hypothetical protein